MANFGDVRLHAHSNTAWKCFNGGLYPLQELVDDFIAMNQAGLVLELCEKYYHENVLMLNNETVFAESMSESYEKQKSFFESVNKFDVKLVSSVIEGNVSELVFHYRMTAHDLTVTEFTGKHIQTWTNKKIIKEEYLSIADK